jgi:tetratricopeptide (TPR) repeat protein
MNLINLQCSKCGASLQIDESATHYSCKYCQTVYERESINLTSPTPNSLLTVSERAYSRSEYGKAMQFIEQGLSIDPNHSGLLSLEEKTRAQLNILVNQQANIVKENQYRSEAENYAREANQILTTLQINLKVYKSNSGKYGSTPADVDLGLQYIDRALEFFPKNADYLNLKALLLWEGKRNKATAVSLLEKANALDPRNITIAHNLQVIKSS